MSDLSMARMCVRDYDAMKRALESLERCHDEHCALPAENGVVALQIAQRRVARAIKLLKERLSQ